MQSDVERRPLTVLRWIAVIPICWAVQMLLSLGLIQLLNNIPSNTTTAALIVVWSCLSLAVAAFAGAAAVTTFRAAAAALGGGVILTVQVVSLLSMAKASDFQARSSWVALAAGGGGVILASLAARVSEKRLVRSGRNKSLPRP